MDQLFGSRTPFAVVATADADLGDIQALAASFHVEVVALEALQRHLVQADERGRPICVEREGDLLGVATSSAAGAAQIQDQSDLLTLLTGARGFSHFRIDLDGASQFGPWLYGRLADIAVAYRNDAAQMRRSNAVLRREHDETLERFTALERNYVLAAPTRTAKLQYPAAGPSMLAHHLVQRLPISTAGIAMVELKLDQPPTSAQGRLHISLFAQGQPEALEHWSLDAERLRPGWLSLRTRCAVATRAMEGRLEIQWDGEPAQAPTLQLSSPTPLQEYAVTIPEATETPRPLALRIWAFTPGARLPTDHTQGDGGESGAQRDEPLLRFSLAVKDLMRSELLHPLGLDLGFNPVSFRSEGGDVMIHPNATGPTVGIVRDVPIAEAKALKAIVRVDNKSAYPVEFGLALVASQAIHADPLHHIRTWTRVEHSVFVEAPGDVDPPSGPYDLLLATRMADGGDPHLAWALFKKIEVTA